MARGRRPSGPEIADKLDGSEQARKRLRVVLETIAGRLSVTEACAELGIGAVAFHEVRLKALRGAVRDLEPRLAGRPRRRLSPVDARVAELEAEVTELKIDLRAAQVREELSLVLPHVLKPREKEKKKRGKGRKRKR